MHAKMLFRRCIAVAFCVLVACSAVGADTNSASQEMIETYLKREALKLDARFLNGITNRQQWEALRPRLYQEYMEMLGLWPLPERTPLEAAVTGVMERDEGYRVENLHFQSRPGLYVTGNLYLPKNAKSGDKLPAVLYVCGHSARPRDGNKTAFQHHGIWFAMHGYACLVIDTLQLGEIAAIHHGTYRYDRWWWQALGYTPAAVECWNGIRAIDYLQSRPEVDGERIAVTGISGGGAATFWIAAADERVKVAVPVSGMSDLEDYVGDKVVNGHCDCMFHINTFQWPWTHVAALVAPRPMLFANSGHDTIFPMNGNDRIRARLERLYAMYTNRTDRLYDIAVTPGGHEDKPELRLMAYRWINRFLKKDDAPVTEPDLAKIEGKLLRAFPNELPSDEINTKIDETFVQMGAPAIPKTEQEFATWRGRLKGELERLVFRTVTLSNSVEELPSRGSGKFLSEPGIEVEWHRIGPNRGDGGWIVVLGEDESLEDKPAWLPAEIAQGTVLLVSPRNSGSGRWRDPAPFYIQRSLPLLGTTVDTGRLNDVLGLCRAAIAGGGEWKVAGRGRAGVIGAYAAMLEPRIAGVAVVDPPGSHRDGPIFLNVLRVLDVPDAFGMLSPRPLTIVTAKADAFDRTQQIYRAGGGVLKIQPMP